MTLDLFTAQIKAKYGIHENSNELTDVVIFQRGWLNRYNLRCKNEVAETILKPQGKTAAYDWVMERVKHIEEDPIYTTGTGANTLLSGGGKVLLTLLALLCGILK